MAEYFAHRARRTIDSLFEGLDIQNASTRLKFVQHVFDFQARHDKAQEEDGVSLEQDSAVGGAVVGRLVEKAMVTLTELIQDVDVDITHLYRSYPERITKSVADQAALSGRTSDLLQPGADPRRNRTKSPGCIVQFRTASTS